MGRVFVVGYANDFEVLGSPYTFSIMPVVGKLFAQIAIQRLREITVVGDFWLMDLAARRETILWLESVG